eukprot:XP_014780611.1 PREDICTED: segment polarity protein dishevelled homolog DVL-3-like [Octopus bimaculoides]
MYSVSGIPRINGHTKHDRHRDPRQIYESTSMLSSDLESTSFFDSEDDSRFSTVTDTTARSSKYGRHKRRRKRHRLPPLSKTSSFSSITDSTMSLNIITVTLNMDTVNFLGISIVGQSNKGGDGGIYVGSIMKGGAVAQDGRIEPGDMILEVNGISFENMSNDDAVRTLREAVQKPGPITLVVAKCWDPNPKGYFTVPRQEPVRPIDPSAWVAHTTAMRAEYMGRGAPVSSSLSTMTSTSSSLTSSIPESERFDDLNLTVNTDMESVVKAMAQADSGLEIRDRMWLKITIPNAFIGVQALPDFSSLSLEDVDSVSEADRDTLAPLPPPTWNNQYPYSSSSYLPQNLSYVPPYCYTNTDTTSYVGSFVDGCGGPPSATGGVGSGGVVGGGGGGGGGNGSAGSVHSGSELMISFAAVNSVRVDNTFCQGSHRASFHDTSTSPVSKSLLSPIKEFSKHTSSSSKDCTCLISTYNHLRKLWENKNKQISHQHHANCRGNVRQTSTQHVDREQVCRASSMYSSGSSASGSSEKKKDKEKSERKSASPAGSGSSDTDTGSLASARRGAPSERSLPPMPRELGQMPPDLSGSRQSFRMAMGNPCEFFVDVL